MISLIDVTNAVDSFRQPVGHELKLLKDLPEIFDDRVEILASKEYLSALKKKGKILPFSARSGYCKNMHVQILCNYLKALVASKGNILLFTIVPEALLWGIALLKGRKKIVIVTYEHWDKYIFTSLRNHPIRKFLVKKGLQKVDGCIVTNNEYTPKGKYIRIPDYFLTEQMQMLQKKEKKQGCVCLGEMRQGKNIDGLVRVMRNTKIPLLIAGPFQSQTMYKKVKRLQTDNIMIENRNLPYRVYLEYLSSYKYAILPYYSKSYIGRTSGVLLEAIFLGAIPIAPETLLRENRIHGIGFRYLSEIPDLIELYEKEDRIIENKLEKYEFQNVKKKVQLFLNRI